MAIDFPNSPALDDTYTVGSRTWTWTGTNWELKAGVFGAGTVGTTELADNAVTTAKLASDAVTTAKILDANITAAKIASDAVTTAKILDANVTAAKLASGAAVTNIGYTPANVAGPTFTGTVVLPSTTSIGTVSATEIGYVDGVTSAIQTQLNSKLTATTDVTSNRNAVINGNMDVWQRGTSFTIAAGTPQYTVDRWTNYFNGTGTIAQETTVKPATSAFSLKITATATSADNAIFQLIEEKNMARFRGKTVTLSLKLAGTATISPSITLAYSTTANDTLTNTNIAISASSTTTPAINASTFVTWVLTYAIPTTAKTLRIGILSNAVVNTNVLYVSEVQLEAGAVATPFEFEDYGTTLAKCQRYYWRSATGLTTDANSRHAHFRRLNAYQMIATGHCAFPVPMRTEPTVGLYNGNGVGFVDAYGAGQESYVIASGEGLSVYGIGILVKYTNSGLSTTASFNADPSNYSYWANIEASAEL
jgi:hypothetical protein